MNNYEKLISAQKQLSKARYKYDKAIDAYIADFLPVEECPDVKLTVSTKDLPHYKYYVYDEGWGGYLALNIPEFDIRIGIRRCNDEDFGIGFNRIAITKKQ